MRIVITLDPEERAALGEMARSDLRYPRDQMRYLLREAAARRGLMPAEATKDAHHVDEAARRAAIAAASRLK